MLDDERMAAVARGLAHPARVHILRLLAAQNECRGAEVFSGLPLAQSTISEHLRVLKEAGLVSSRPMGTGMVYCLDPSVLSSLAVGLQTLADEAQTCKPGGC